MRWVYGALLLVAVALTQSRAMGAGGVTIRGVRSCGVWIQDRRHDALAAVTDEVWLAGNLSGLAVATSRTFWGTKDVQQLATDG